MIKLFRIMNVGEEGWVFDDRGERDNLQQARASIKEDIQTIPEKYDEMGSHTYYAIVKDDDVYKYFVDVQLDRGGYSLLVKNYPEMQFPEEIMLKILKGMGRSIA